jgi:hypothetical protein
MPHFDKFGWTTGEEAYKKTDEEVGWRSCRHPMTALQKREIEAMVSDC